MNKIDGINYILTEKEYNNLTNPDVCYTLLTKTKANKAVTNLLKYFKHKCHNDIDLNDTCEYSNQDSQFFYCSECPVMTVLGLDAGSVICTRPKSYSK